MDLVTEELMMKFDTHKDTGREVTEALGISRATLHRWEKIEGFPGPLKIGPRRTRYDIGSIKAFLSSAEVKASLSQPPACHASKDAKEPSFAHEGLQGLTLRDYFAAKALATASAYSSEDVATWDAEDFAKHAYSLADAMLAARNS
ncbi:helix-turn-helix transcriptional regulator [Pseudomonas sp. GG8]